MTQYGLALAAAIVMTGNAFAFSDETQKNAEGGVLKNPVQLTFESDFSRAGEAYFSPDGKWIIFQATPADATGSAAQQYGMYIGKLAFDADGAITGLSESFPISHPGSANTCGWFHPTEPGLVMFATTTEPPTVQEPAGYQRGTSRYSWQFHPEMEIVTTTVGQIVSGKPNNAASEATPMFEREGYDAEGSWSPDGRKVVYTRVDESGDADIWIYDTERESHHPLIVAPGYDGGPFFNPRDNNQIIFRSDRVGNDLLQLFTARIKTGPDGTVLEAFDEVQLTDNEHVNWAPFWHPTGAFAIYSTSEVGHRNYEVFAIDSRGSRAAEQNIRVRLTHADGFDGLPVFNEDGSLMMWTSQRGASEGERRSSQLWVAEFDMAGFSQKYVEAWQSLQSSERGAGDESRTDAED